MQLPADTVETAFSSINLSDGTNRHYGSLVYKVQKEIYCTNNHPTRIFGCNLRKNQNFRKNQERYLSVVGQ